MKGFSSLFFTLLEILNCTFSEVGISNRLLVEGLGRDSQAEASVWKYLPNGVSPSFTTIGQRGYVKREEKGNE
jgi:hypothetical protein